MISYQKQAASLSPLLASTSFVPVLSLSHSAHSELIDANGWRGGRAPGVLLSGYVLLATTSSAFFLLDVRNAWGHAGAFGPAR